MEVILDNVKTDRVAFDGLGHIYPADSSVEIFHEQVEGVNCYRFEPAGFDKNKAVIYLHGGMFVLGSIDGYKAMISHFASAFSAKILFVEYSLAPEKPFPHATNDILKTISEFYSEISGCGHYCNGRQCGRRTCCYSDKNDCR